jgi:hypothetical protein
MLFLHDLLEGPPTAIPLVGIAFERRRQVEFD